MSDGTENAGYSSEDILDEKVNSKTYGDENLNKPPEIKITLDVDNHNPALEKDEDIKVHSMNTGNCFLNSPNRLAIRQYASCQLHFLVIILIVS